LIKVLTLDPGVTTGYCLAVIEDPRTVFLAYGEERINVRQLWDGMNKLSPDVLICEDFTYRNRARAGLDLTPVKMIGVVELWAAPMNLAIGRTSKGREIFFQTAAEGKGHYKDQALRDAGVYKKGVNHGRDACRHFLQWLTFGAGYQHTEGEPELKLVDVLWILGAYWDHTDPWR
jgi:hypothetical protein